MAKQYWLMKSEPDVYSIDDLARDRKSAWEGVRNYQARNHLRAMKVGDLAFFHHSSADPPGIAGIARVSREAYPDPSQFDPESDYYDAKSKRDDPRWSLVEIEFVRKLDRLLPMDELRGDARAARHGAAAARATAVGAAGDGRRVEGDLQARRSARSTPRRSSNLRPKEKDEHHGLHSDVTGSVLSRPCWSWRRGRRRGSSSFKAASSRSTPTPRSLSSARTWPRRQRLRGGLGQRAAGRQLAGIFGRRFSSAGSPLAGEFQVTLYTVGAQFLAKVAGIDSGFVVTWTSDEQDGNDYGVFGRLFGSTGSPVGAEFQVATRTTGRQLNPEVARDGAGGFVVVWESLGDYNLEGVFGQRFSSSGARVGEQFQVNTYFTERQVEPSVAEHGPGFVVVWQSDNGQDGYSSGIFGQLYDGFGSRLGGEFQVNSRTSASRTRPWWRATTRASSFCGAVSMAGARECTAVGSTEGVLRRRASSGSTTTSPWRSLAHDSGVERRVVPGGVGHRRGGASPPRRTRYPRRRRPQLNTYTNNYQIRASVARVDGSGFVVVWTSQFQDGSSYGIFGRRVKLPADFDVDGNGVVDPLTDTLLALRYVFGFRGATLITGAVGAGCTRCDAPSIEAYLAGKV